MNGYDEGIISGIEKVRLILDCKSVGKFISYIFVWKRTEDNLM